MNERAPNRTNTLPSDQGLGIAARAMGAAQAARPKADTASYLDGLNPEQKEAVLTTEGPLLVLAGAGTGKTRVLTTRITHILQQRLAWPSQILAVTFTNKAAREMKERIAQQVGEAVEGMPWLGTFHSISVKILRRHAELVGLKSNFTILDTDDQVRLLKQLIQAANIDDKRWPARQLASQIDSWKNKALGPEEISEGEARAFGNGRGRELYRQYQERLKILNACDFGDLLVESIRLFRENGDVLADYHGRFRYILVDEYQDTNVAQYIWLQLLAGKGQAGTNTSPSRGGRRSEADAGGGSELSLGSDANDKSLPPARNGEAVSTSPPGGGEEQAGHSKIPAWLNEAPFPEDELPASPQKGGPRSEADWGGGLRVTADSERDDIISPHPNAASQPSTSPPVGGYAVDNSENHAAMAQFESLAGPPSQVSASEERADAYASPPRSVVSEADTRGVDGGTPDGAEREVIANQSRASISNANSSPNLCCVGDDDQSIYGWRGAEVDNILRFDKDYPDAKVIRLERNYRSTSHILKAASHLITHNEGRLGKTLFTDLADPDEAKVKVAAGWDSEEEARAIGEEIEALQTKKHNLNQIAILVRASFQMREFEDRFVSLGLNYRVIGGPRFYERMEIRDAMAYFRVVCQPADDLAFERIVNTPKRGLGDATIKLIRDHARARRIPMLAAVRELTETEELKPKQRGTLRTLALNFARWSEQLDVTKHTDLAEIILDESGYTDFWQNDRSAEAPGRLENLKELVRSMEEFESMRGFMEHVSLVMDTDRTPDQEAVNLMTLHSAKGLEFDTVFLPGWEEGLFPHQRSLDEGGRAGLEEERRLAYVGITRARKNCHIWFVSNRRIHGQWQASIPSRFIDELPMENVEVVEPSGNYGGYGRGNMGGMGNPYGKSRFDSAEPFSSSGYSSPGWRRAQANQNEDTAKNWGTRSGYKSTYQGGPRTIEGELVAKSVVGADESLYDLGERVFHMKFGYGKITHIDGNKLTIDFEKAGEKRVLDSFVERP